MRLVFKKLLGVTPGSIQRSRQNISSHQDTNRSKRAP
jgi:hypothetical protein